MYSRKSFCFGEKVVAFGQSGCIWPKVVVIGQSGCIRARVVVFGQICLFGPSDCIRENLLYSRKVVEFVQKWLYSGKGGLFRVEWL